MNYLFTNAPLFVPGMNMKEFDTHDLEHRVEEAKMKHGVEHAEDHSLEEPKEYRV
jgi:hypothetical protein